MQLCLAIYITSTVAVVADVYKVARSLLVLDIFAGMSVICSFHSRRVGRNNLDHVKALTQKPELTENASHSNVIAPNKFESTW